MNADRTPQVVLDRYELHDVLGRGGWGTVWRAWDTLLGREVAIKEVIVPDELGGSDRHRAEERVLREARAAAGIHHRAAVTVYDVVRDEGRALIVMELVRGRSLGRIVGEDGPLPPERAARYGLEVLSVLMEAHRRGVVHRDVKPGNVMASDDGVVKLTDFGIATLRDEASLTLTGQVLGSPQYMAPEQARGERAGPATDLWGLGATLYFAVEGRPPFEADHPLAILASVLHSDPPPPANAGPLAAVIEALLQKDPSRRASPEEARALLQEVAADRVPASESTEPVPAPDAGSEQRATEPTTLGDLFPSTSEEAPEERRPSAERTGGRWIWALGALAAGVLVLVAALGLFRGPAGQMAPLEEASPSPASPTPETPPTSAETPPAEPSPAGAVPAGWTMYRDGAVGYRIAYPEGWEVVPLDETRTDFRDPETGTLLRVDWTDQPGPSPVAAWESYSQEFAAEHEGYQEIRIDPTTFRGFDAAEWEFTYVEDGVTLHALDLGFVTGKHGFALFFQTSEERWAGSQAVFEAFKTSFRPPA